MPEDKLIEVYYEGDDDKVFLESLRDGGFLPGRWQIAKRDKTVFGGKNGLMRQLVPFVSPLNGIGGDAVVLIDFDEKSADESFSWFQSELRTTLGSMTKSNDTTDVTAGSRDGNVQLFVISALERSGRVALVAVGNPVDRELVEWGIDRYAIDDWVFRLILTPKVYESVTEFRPVKHEIAVQRFREVAHLFRTNGLEVRKAKTYLQILRALTAIRPATSTMISRIVRNAIVAMGKDAFREQLLPFLQDLAKADQLLSN